MRLFIISLYLLAGSSAYAWDLGKMGQFRFDQVNNQVYVMHGPLGEPSPENQGFMNNPGLVLSKNGVIIVDPGSTYQVGQEVLREVEKITDKPVLAVFNTHIHGDHWLGNQAIKEQYPQARIYGHPNMIQQASGSQGLNWIDIMERMTEGKSKGTKVVAPELAVDNSAEIEVDGEHFRIHALIPAHTNTDIMIEHVESRTLFLGDNSFNKRMGRFDSSASMKGNIKALEYARDLNMKIYIPGHGQTGTFDTAAKPFLEYLTQVEAAVQDGFDQEMQDFEIKNKVIGQFSGYHSWVGFDENFGKHINSMYLEIEKSAW